MHSLSFYGLIHKLLGTLREIHRDPFETFRDDIDVETTRSAFRPVKDGRTTNVGLVYKGDVSGGIAECCRVVAVCWESLRALAGDQIGLCKIILRRIGRPKRACR